MAVNESRGWGGHSNVWPLRRVLVNPPVPPAPEADWREFGYLRRMNHLQAVEEHAAFRRILRDAGVEILTGEIDNPMLQDAIFPFDPVFTTDAGAVLTSMGKPLREDEVRLAEYTMTELNIPIAGRIEPPGLLEGGDCLWVDERTLAIGRGYRTNDEGISQMAAIMARQGVEVVRVGLPHWHGPAECLHLLSLISMLDDDLAVVHLPLLDVGFIDLLRERGIKLIEISENEFVTQATNVLVTSPRKCVMLRENPVTGALLEAAGCDVTFYTGGEISHNTPQSARLARASGGRLVIGGPWVFVIDSTC
jgi:N-dimethylarginine dimethylaminohydrolase